MRYELSTDIQADAATVWAALTDVVHWPEWTPSMTSVRRLDHEEFGVGSRVEVCQPRLPRAVWEVTGYESGREFTWRSRSGGVTTLAEHLITARENGGVSVCLRVTQTGPLAPLAAVFTSRLTRRYVQTEANGLRTHCETAR